LVEQDLLASLDLVMQEMRVTMPGVRIDRSTAVRYVLTKALAPYARTREDSGTLEEAMAADLSPTVEDQSVQKAAQGKDQHRTTDRTGRKRVKAVQEG
jgi:hypothetical protein